MPTSSRPTAGRGPPRSRPRSSPSPTPCGTGWETPRGVLRDSVAAISAGIVAGEAVLDLDYPEDSTAEVDLNVVRLGGGGLVEVQGTGEGGTFPRAQLQALLDLAEAGLDRLGELQRECLGADWPPVGSRSRAVGANSVWAAGDIC